MLKYKPGDLVMYTGSPGYPAGPVRVCDAPGVQWIIHAALDEGSVYIEFLKQPGVTLWTAYIRPLTPLERLLYA